MEKRTSEESSSGLLKHAGTVTFFTLLSRILGAARDLVIAHFFGAGWITDAFVQLFSLFTRKSERRKTRLLHACLPPKAWEWSWLGHSC